MIRAVIFDLFGVLVTEGYKQFRETYFAEDKAKEQEANDLIGQVDSGLISIEEFRDGLAELAGITADKVNELLGNNQPNRPLLDYIRTSLKGQYKIGILSNSSQDYPAKLLSEEDLKLFDDIVLSYRLGMVKPQREIYEQAAESLGVSPQECVFIDDSPGHCEGAKNAGMTALGYESFGRLKADLEQVLAKGGPSG